PEGIETRGARTFFAGSTSSGAIYKGNLKSGQGSVFIPATEGHSAIGLDLRGGVLYVSGGSTGAAWAYDVSTGAELKSFQFTTEQTFINDAVATDKAVYFTDSVNPVLYKVPITGKGQFGDTQTLTYSGDLVYQEGFNVNGIDGPASDEYVIVVQSNTGKLFKVDPNSGATDEIDLGGENVQNGDGILLDPRGKLWVVQNQQKLLTLIRLNQDATAGGVGSRSEIPGSDVPTTVARSGDYLALVNARFGNESPETAEYWVTQMKRPVNSY
ncbi:MAG: hypothetical protein QOK47_52, partial [Actinomycetota bacterium]|nr:hypothetical protein [Actinomycetota bacterium]